MSDDGGSGVCWGGGGKQRGREGKKRNTQYAEMAEDKDVLWDAKV